MRLTEEQIQKIVEDLQGTCKSLDQSICEITDGEAEGLDEVDNWQELCDAVDRAHFCCAGCGWWWLVV